MKEITNGELQAILKQHPESYEVQLEVEHSTLFFRSEKEIDEDHPIESDEEKRVILIRETEMW